MKNRKIIIGILFLFLVIFIAKVIVDYLNTPKTEKASGELESLVIPSALENLYTKPLLKSGKYSGMVKIAFFREGSEHITTPIVIQWLKEDQEVRELTIQKEEILNKDGLWALSLESFEQKGDILEIHLTGSSTYQEDAFREYPFVIKIDSEGILSDPDFYGIQFGEPMTQKQK